MKINLGLFSLGVLLLLGGGCASPLPVASKPVVAATAAKPEAQPATDKTLRSITLGNWCKVVGDVDGKATLESEVWRPAVTVIVTRFAPTVAQRADGTYLITWAPKPAVATPALPEATPTATPTPPAEPPQP